MAAMRPQRSTETVWREIGRLAARQHGVISRAQARAAGLSDSAIARATSAGRLERVHRNVYRMAGSPTTTHQRLMAACLWAGEGAYVSHRSAAAMRELPGVHPTGVDISLPRGHPRSVPPGIIVHRPRRVERGDLTRLAGIPISDPARTLIDIAATEDPETLEVALDDALRRGLVSLPRLRRRLSRMPPRGRGGMGLLRRLVADRSPATVLPESPLETRLIRLLRAAKLPPPVRQHQIRERGRLIARLDLAYPEARLAIEADGYRYHSGRIAFEGDLARRNALQALGWRVLHVTWRQLDGGGAPVIEMVRTMLDPPRP